MFGSKKKDSEIAQAGHTREDGAPVGKNFQDGPPVEKEMTRESEIQQGEYSDNADELQRKLENRQIQLLAIGGSIGTALFVSIGNGLAAGGPGSLFIAYTFYSFIVAMVNNCIAEMAVLQPVSGGFIRLAGYWVDDALGFMVGWNFFIYESLLIPFEITAINLVLRFWTDKIPVAVVCIVVIILYGLINCLAVKAYGEAEFWLSGGKVILIFMLFFFTFVTMVGGNPQHDAYGFRYWKNPPGAFAPYRSTGSKGEFEGFLAALWSASFTIVGPEYISMAAAETKRPRTYVKTAFKNVYWRFGLFFILGALCVGIVVPWNDPKLQAVLNGTAGGSGTASASPYVIAMQNLGIGVLPDIVNALLLTSIFSAGNTYTYAATRTLYGLALEGRAPRILKKCTKNGVPIFCFAVVMCFPFLSFLAVSSSASIVITWFVDLITAGALIDFWVICFTYIRFHKACKVQGVDRNSFPYTGRFQPYCAWIAIVFESLVILFYGYTAFGPPNVANFFKNYTMQILAPVLYIFWKLLKRTKMKKIEEIDLVWQAPGIDAYEESFINPPIGFWTEMSQLIGMNRHYKEQRRASVATMVNPTSGDIESEKMKEQPEKAV